MGFFRAAFACVFSLLRYLRGVLRNRNALSKVCPLPRFGSVKHKDQWNLSLSILFCIPMFSRLLKNSVAFITALLLTFFVGLTFAVETVPGINQSSIANWTQADLDAWCILQDGRWTLGSAYLLDPIHLRCDYVETGYWDQTYIFVYENACPTNSGSPSGGLCTCNTGYSAASGQCVQSYIKPKNLSRPDFCSIGNPVNQGTGNKYQVETDYIGTGPFPIGMQRYYNGDSQVINTLWGANWRSQFDHSIVVNANIATVYRPDGKAFVFFRPASISTWNSVDTDITDRLQQTASGWTYTTSDDEVETYDTNGKLLSITNRAGLTQTLTYSDGTTGQNGGYVLDATSTPTTTVLPAGLLIRVTDASVLPHVRN